MKPGSLRIVGKHPEFGGRIVDKFEPGQVGEFYAAADEYERGGYTLWLYEMTDKGWTEF